MSEEDDKKRTVDEFCVVVTAPDGWGQSHGIDMLTSRDFREQPVGFCMDGWTVAARDLSHAEAERVRDAALQRQLDAMVLVFEEEVLS